MGQEGGIKFDAGSRGVSLINELAGSELSIRERQPDEPTGTQHALAFLEHTLRLFQVEMLERMG